MEKLWGDNYYDAPSKKWKTDPVDSDGKPLKRGFVTFIMDPICRLAVSCMEGNTELMNKIL
jgi:elongation factor 2